VLALDVRACELRIAQTMELGDTKGWEKVWA
jgi:hypothetical protein